MAELLGDFSEGGAHRIMVRAYPDDRVKVVWIRTTTAGHSHWHEAVYPLGDIAALRGAADACERNRSDDGAGAPDLCDFMAADGTRFRAPGSLLLRALCKIPGAPEPAGKKRRRSPPRRTAPDPSADV